MKRLAAQPSVQNRAALTEVYERLQHAGRPVIEQGETTCCYARSEKNWVDDPQGVQWETFLATGRSAVYGTDEVSAKAATEAAACCAPSCCAPGGV